MASFFSSSAHVRAFALGLVLALVGLGGFTWWQSSQAPGAASAEAIADGDLPVVTVYKSPTCGCCVKWVEHLEANGFTVEQVDRTDMATVKQKQGLPRMLASCHTGVVDGYVVEGHVPAQDVKRLLAERPEGVDGLAVPGMPVGSPGMEQGDREDPYNVVAFSRDGRTGVFASYNK
jgi:hypothetical protein